MTVNEHTSFRFLRRCGGSPSPGRSRRKSSGEMAPKEDFVEDMYEDFVEYYWQKGLMKLPHCIPAAPDDAHYATAASR